MTAHFPVSPLSFMGVGGGSMEIPLASCCSREPPRRIPLLPEAQLCFRAETRKSSPGSGHTSALRCRVSGASQAVWRTREPLQKSLPSFSITRGAGVHQWAPPLPPGRSCLPASCHCPLGFLEAFLLSAHLGALPPGAASLTGVWVPLWLCIHLPPSRAPHRDTASFIQRTPLPQTSWTFLCRVPDFHGFL